MSDLPTFSVRERTITMENPTVITDGLIVCKEAYIEIDTTNMSQTFVHLLMHHMGEGNIRVKVARVKEQPERGYTTERNAWTGNVTHTCRACHKQFRGEHSAKFHECDAGKSSEEKQQ